MNQLREKEDLQSCSGVVESADQDKPLHPLMKVLVAVAELYPRKVRRGALALLTGLTKCGIILDYGFQIFSLFFLAHHAEHWKRWGLAKRSSPQRHDRDRHYNYPREDAVLIPDPDPDKTDTLGIDMICFDIGSNINNGTA